MLYIFQALLTGVLLGFADCLMQQSDFQSLIAPRCYNKTNDNKELINGQRIPLGNSIEVFVSLLERFERNYTSLSPTEIAELFLLRFRIDGIRKMADGTYTQNERERTRFYYIEELLNPKLKAKDFPEEAFTEEEKCALYFMLSHTFDRENANDMRTTISPNDKSDIGPIERGVVTLDNHKIHAIALGKVLLGILAGLRNYAEESVEFLVGKVSPRLIDNSPDPETRKQYDGKIEPLYGVTVGDTIAEEVLRVVNITVERTSRKFGPNGKWNSTFCPVTYYLDDKETDATYAQVRGAADGLLLGLKAMELSKGNRPVPISNLIRMYYSQRGVGVAGSMFSYCERYPNWGKYHDRIIDQIHNYARLVNVYKHGVKHDDATLRDRTSKALSEFDHSKSKLITEVTDLNKCYNKDQDSQPFCETPSDVFVILDVRENRPEYRDLQKEIITKLGGDLDLGIYGDSLSVFTNFRSFGDRVLEDIAYNTTLKGCVGCRLEWFDFRTLSGTQAEEVYVFESLNKTLMTFELEKDHLSGVPGKSVIYFNYGDKLRTDRNLNSALREIRRKHRDVEIFAIGLEENRETLEKFASSKENVFTKDTAENIEEDLFDRICENPSTLQYQMCREKKSDASQQNTYNGFVTPSRIQYWSMYPEYFLKSFTIKFSFTSMNGNIRVCYSRVLRTILNNEAKRCFETSSTDQTVDFKITDPCKYKDLYDCAPFHFSIKGMETGATGSTQCSEKECKFLDQIKFTIKHEGVSCNNSSCLFSSLQVILLLLSLYTVTRKYI